MFSGIQIFYFAFVAVRSKRIFTRRAETGRCNKISFVVGLYGPLREKAESERPQSFQFCKNKNKFSAEYGQSLRRPF